MRFSVQLLAIVATVLSFNATPRQAPTPMPVSVIAPTLQAPVAAVDDQAREAAASSEEHSRGTSPLAWVLAGGFLTLVALRRMRSPPLD